MTNTFLGVEARSVSAHAASAQAASTQDGVSRSEPRAGQAFASLLSVNAEGRSAAIRRRVQHWASARPGETALLHKRKGDWHATSWQDVLGGVERLSARLQHVRRGETVRLVASGAYEPGLILIALAAHAAGGDVVPVASDLADDDLRRLLTDVRPSHAFVQSRRTIARWLAVQPSGGGIIPLFSDQSVARRAGTWDIIPLDALHAGSHGPKTATARPSKDRDVVWIDEGTEWQDGLPLLLDRWLVSGAALAFPETTASATRDRPEVSPTSLLCSASRRERLRSEIDDRLAVRPGLAKSICDLARTKPDGFVARVARRRIDGILGLRNIAWSDLADLGAGREGPGGVR